MTDWSEEKPTASLVKSMVTVPEVAEMLGLEIVAQKVCSPWNPDERTPSCHLYEDHFWDYSTGKGGDIFDLVQAYNPEMPLGKILYQLWNKSLKAGREPGDVERAAPRVLEDFTDRFRQEDSGYVWKDWDTLLPPNVKVQKRGMLIPHQDQDGIYGVKTRDRDGTKSAWVGSQFAKRLYDPDGWEDPDIEGVVILCEGESDSWAIKPLVPDSVAVLALPAGASTFKDHWLQDLRLAQRVLVCMDNDSTGKAAEDKLIRKIGFLKAEALRVPPLYKDARAAIAAGWRPQLG